MWNVNPNPNPIPSNVCSFVVCHSFESYANHFFLFLALAVAKSSGLENDCVGLLLLHL